jgi:hypothetical protein
MNIHFIKTLPCEDVKGNGLKDGGPRPENPLLRREPPQRSRANEVLFFLTNLLPFFHRSTIILWYL